MHTDYDKLFSSVPINKLAAIVTNQRGCSDSYQVDENELRNALKKRLNELRGGRERFERILGWEKWKIKEHLHIKRQNRHYRISGLPKELSDDYFHLIECITAIHGFLNTKRLKKNERK